MALRLPKPLLIILAAGFILRLLFFISIFYTQGSEAFLVSDSKAFTQIAQNILAGNGFSRSLAPPFLPSAHFPPLYSLFIAGSLWLTSSVIPLIVLQMVIGSLLPLIVWKIGQIFTDKRGVHILASSLMALEPAIAIFGLLLITDTISVFFLLLAALFFLRALERPSLLNASYAGASLALSTLTKPNAQFLFLAGLAVLLVYPVWKRQQIIRYAMIFAIIFLVILSPWLVRNAINFGSPSISSTGLRNLYTDFAVSVISYDTGRPYGEVEEELKASFAEHHDIAPAEIGENPSLGGALAKEGLQIALSRPKASIAVLAITLQTFFTQDLWVYFAQRFHLISPMNFDFSPSLVLLKEGPLTLAARIWEFMGVYLVIPLIGRLFWIASSFFALIGFYKALRAGGRERTAAVIITAIIFYYAATSAVAAFSDQGRHRYPADAFIFLLASYGIVRLFRPTSKILPTI